MNDEHPLPPETHPRQKPSSFWRRYGYWIVPGALLALSLATAATSFRRSDPQDGRRPRRESPAPIASRGGTFRFPLMTPVLSLDPARAKLGSEILLMQQLYDGLTAFDQHLNIVPALAQYWEISPDGRTYTFEIRPDARFHNKRPVTAEDCVFSFERLLTPGLNEDNVHYFSPIEGAEAFRNGLADHVSGLRALGKRTFQIRFTTPLVPALSVLSMYCSKILPKKEALAAGDEFFESPIGTGPFRFSRWIERGEDPAVPYYRDVPQALRLEASSDYFRETAYLDTLVFRAIWNDPDVEVEVPMNQLVDCIETPVDQYEDWVPVETDKQLALSYLLLPNDVPPFDDPRVRRAVNYALDKRSFLGLDPSESLTPAARGIVPPGIPGFPPLEVSYGHNLEKARRLLAEAGYPGGRGIPPLEVAVYRTDPAARASNKCFASCMGNVGIEVKLVKMKGFVRPGDPAVRGRAMLFRAPMWIADFPDPDNFLRPLFHSASPVNRSGYRNPKVDRLLDRAWSETSYSERNKLYHKIEKVILEDMPIIPLGHGRSRFLVRPNVRGFTLSPMGSTYIRLDKVWLQRSDTAPKAGL